MHLHAGGHAEQRNPVADRAENIAGGAVTADEQEQLIGREAITLAAAWVSAGVEELGLYG